MNPNATAYFRCSREPVSFDNLPTLSAMTLPVRAAPPNSQVGYLAATMADVSWYEHGHTLTHFIVFRDEAQVNEVNVDAWVLPFSINGKGEVIVDAQKGGFRTTFPFQNRDPLLHTSEWSGVHAIAKLVSYPKGLPRITGLPKGSVLDGFVLCSFNRQSSTLTTQTLQMPDGLSVKEPVMLFDAYCGRILVRSGFNSTEIHVLSYV